MRNIDSSVMAQLESGELRPFFLMDLEMNSTHYRYTDCDVPIVYGGNIYSPRGFTLSEIQYSLSKIVDQATVDMENIDGVFTSLFVGGDPRGSQTILFLVVLDSNGQIIGSPVTLFEGDLDAWDLDEEKVPITLASEASRWAKKTLTKQASSCRWKVFKGTECGYAGSETWCDRSYSRCEALSNADNFGGERWLPSIVDKEIWWGRKPK